MNTARLYSSIDELGALLRAAGMAHGVDVWLSVARLLKQLEERGKLPKDEKDLAPLLGPLLCRNPEEQARFPELFKQWLNRETQPVLETVNRTAAPGRGALLAAQAAAQKNAKALGHGWHRSIPLPAGCADCQLAGLVPAKTG